MRSEPLFLFRAFDYRAYILRVKAKKKTFTNVKCCFLLIIFRQNFNLIFIFTLSYNLQSHFITVFSLVTYTCVYINEVKST